MGPTPPLPQFANHSVN